MHGEDLPLSRVATCTMYLRKNAVRQQPRPFRTLSTQEGSGGARSECPPPQSRRLHVTCAVVLVLLSALQGTYVWNPYISEVFNPPRDLRTHGKQFLSLHDQGRHIDRPGLLHPNHSALRENKNHQQQHRSPQRRQGRSDNYPSKVRASFSR